MAMGLPQIAQSNIGGFCLEKIRESTDKKRTAILSTFHVPDFQLYFAFTLESPALMISSHSVGHRATPHSEVCLPAGGQALTRAKLNAALLFQSLHRDRNLPQVTRIHFINMFFICSGCEVAACSFTNRLHPINVLRDRWPVIVHC